MIWRPRPRQRLGKEQPDISELPESIAGALRGVLSSLKLPPAGGDAKGGAGGGAAAGKRARGEGSAAGDEGTGAPATKRAARGGA